MIRIKVGEGKISIVSNQTQTTNAINYYKIKFEFNEAWNRFTEKYATFYQNVNGARYKIAIPSSNIVTVPYEMLDVNLPYYIGVYGVTENERATTNNVKINVVEGSFREDMSLVDDVSVVEVIGENGEIIKLKGEYDGSPINVTQNGNINIRDYINENKIPLDVNVQIPEKEIILQSKTITPTKEKLNVVYDSGYTGLGNVVVNPIPQEYIIPNGTLEIKENGNYDITDKKNVVVAIEGQSGEPIIVATEQEMINIANNATSQDYGKIYQYTGETTAQFTKNTFYILEEV